MSFGHLSFWGVFRSARPREVETATAMDAMASLSGGSLGRRITEKSSEPRLGRSNHVLSPRPRPSVWWSVTTIDPSLAPCRAHATARLFVESHSAKNRMGFFQRHSAISRASWLMSKKGVGAMAVTRIVGLAPYHGPRAPHRRHPL